MRRCLRVLFAMGCILLSGAALGACSSTPADDATPSTLSSLLPSSGDPFDLTGTTVLPPVPALVLTSSAFADGAPIPLKYGCTSQGGANVSPPLAWTGGPTSANTFVLVVHDPDAPQPGGFTHLVTTFPPSLTAVSDGANQSGNGPMAKWMGPCPPSGRHHYVFTLYAFGPEVSIPSGIDKNGVDDIASKALATATLTGLYGTP